MSKKMKIIVFISVLIMMTAILAGCSADETPTPSPTPLPIPVSTPEPAPVSTPEPVPAGDPIEWISPMLSISVSATEASVFNGEPLVIIDTNDHGRENRGMVAEGMPEEGQAVVPAQLTAAHLEAHGAVKLTARFSYEGDEEFPIRFRVRVDMFQGHNVTSYGLGVTTGMLVLWQDDNGTWWNMRRTGWGGEFTGGTDTPGWFFAEGHSRAGEPYPVFAFDINKDTALNFATQDFYIIFLEEAPLRRNDAGIVTDETAGYVITYQAELPDDDGHFHNFFVLISTSTYIHIHEDPHVNAHDCDDDCDDH
jgi:hypothetical protein